MSYATPARTRSLYRARDGLIFGVCRGLSRFSGIPTWALRLALIIVFFMTGFFPIVLIYIVAALFMKPEPIVPPITEEDWEFYNSYASDRAMALARLKRKFDEVERRARRLEDIVTARDFEWNQRIRSS